MIRDFVENPEEWISDPRNLEHVCQYIVDNFAMPDSVFSQFGLPYRFYDRLVKLAKEGDEKANHILDNLDLAADKWMINVRKDIIHSGDKRAIATLLKEDKLKEQNQKLKEENQKLKASNRYLKEVNGLLKKDLLEYE